LIRSDVRQDCTGALNAKRLRWSIADLNRGIAA
jgi:hypothetical protein